MKKDNMNVSSPCIQGADFTRYDNETKKWTESGLFAEDLVFDIKESGVIISGGQPCIMAVDADEIILNEFE
ncbi:hypothetical protein BpHYR1_008774 [Brachionus plicatilis]|uniref:Uncharacterized protein n=1 Tax=Brachionus plicatilis TaxID=10195 RepID=A0A3M7PBV3_BRAPC|nr:hypothetical protein BpHYR1_008774 [Brachionus plicatilis]